MRFRGYDWDSRDRIRPLSVRTMHDKEVKRYVQENSRIQER
jgi:uncharacterized DUF497 family protein